MSYDYVVEGCVTLAEAGEADFDDHVLWLVVFVDDRELVIARSEVA